MNLTELKQADALLKKVGYVRVEEQGLRTGDVIFTHVMNPNTRLRFNTLETDNTPAMTITVEERAPRLAALETVKDFAFSVMVNRVGDYLQERRETKERFGWDVVQRFPAGVLSAWVDEQKALDKNVASHTMAAILKSVDTLREEGFRVQAPARDDKAVTMMKDGSDVMSDLREMGYNRIPTLQDASRLDRARIDSTTGKVERMFRVLTWNEWYPVKEDDKKAARPTLGTKSDLKP